MKAKEQADIAGAGGLLPGSIPRRNRFSTTGWGASTILTRAAAAEGDEGRLLGKLTKTNTG
jgi:hypothetical protein